MNWFFTIIVSYAGRPVTQNLDFSVCFLVYDSCKFRTERTVKNFSPMCKIVKKIVERENINFCNAKTCKVSWRNYYDVCFSTLELFKKFSFVFAHSSVVKSCSCSSSRNLFEFVLKSFCAKSVRIVRSGLVVGQRNCNFK